MHWENGLTTFKHQINAKDWTDLDEPLITGSSSSDGCIAPIKPKLIVHSIAYPLFAMFCEKNVGRHWPKTLSAQVAKKKKIKKKWGACRQVFVTRVESWECRNTLQFKITNSLLTS